MVEGTDNLAPRLMGLALNQISRFQPKLCYCQGLSLECILENVSIVE